MIKLTLILLVLFMLTYMIMANIMVSTKRKPVINVIGIVCAVLVLIIMGSVLLIEKHTEVDPLASKVYMLMGVSALSLVHLIYRLFANRNLY